MPPIPSRSGTPPWRADAPVAGKAVRGLLPPLVLAADDGIPRMPGAVRFLKGSRGAPKTASNPVRQGCSTPRARFFGRRTLLLLHLRSKPGGLESRRDD